MKKTLHIATLLVLLPTVLLAAKQPERKDIRAGNREYKKGSYSEAELSYRRAMEKAPGAANPKFNLGNALYKQVDSTMAQTAPEEAKQLQEQVRKLYESAAEAYSDDKQKAAAHYNAGNTHLREQNWPAAIDAYKKALRLNPDDMEAKQNLVFAQAMNNQQPPQQQQQQQQQQDKDKDDKDDKKDPQQQPQDNKDQDRDSKDRQPQEQEQKISKEDAQRMLEALEQQEKDTQERVKREKAQRERQQASGKNW